MYVPESQTEMRNKLFMDTDMSSVQWRPFCLNCSVVVLLAVAGNAPGVEIGILQCDIYTMHKENDLYSVVHIAN